MLLLLLRSSTSLLLNAADAAFMACENPVIYETYLDKLKRPLNDAQCCC